MNCSPTRTLKMAIDRSAHSKRLGTWDYIIIIGVICISGILGLYHVWRSRKSKNTLEFLVANRNFGIVPLVLSTVATYLAPSTMLGQPMETYSNGVQMMLLAVGVMVSHLFAMFATIPVFFQLNVCTVNQYLEYRFNRFLRIFPAAFGLLQNSIMIASFTYVTALVLSQATGVHFWGSMAIICGICIIYSALGGVTAVIWTDVLQVVVIFVSLGALAIKGTLDVGTLNDIWEKNRLGKRTILFHLQPNPDSNYTVWSLLFGNYFLFFGGAILSQSALQRQMANRSLSKARMTVVWTVILMAVASVVVCWIGMVMYARYAGCDPLLNGEIASRDQIAALFAMEIFNNHDGLFGLFVSGILATTLSTLSSVLNSVSTVALIDFIRPLAPKMSDKTSTLISKVLGILYGVLVVALTGIVEHFGSIIQVLHAVAGTSLGPTAGIFILGFFFPWTTSQGATVGYFTGLAFGWWASIGRLMHKSAYLTAPMSTASCNITGIMTTAFNLTANDSSPAYLIDALSSFNASEIISPPESEVFPLYRIIPIWYAGMTMTVVVFVGFTVSCALGPQNPEKLDPRLISPLVYAVLRIVPHSIRCKLGYKWWKPNEQKLVMPVDVPKELGELELHSLKLSHEEGSKNETSKMLT